MFVKDCEVFGTAYLKTYRNVIKLTELLTAKARYLNFLIAFRTQFARCPLGVFRSPGAKYYTLLKRVRTNFETEKESLSNVLTTILQQTIFTTFTYTVGNKNDTSFLLSLSSSVQKSYVWELNKVRFLMITHLCIFFSAWGFYTGPLCCPSISFTSQAYDKTCVFSFNYNVSGNVFCVLVIRPDRK